VGVGILEDAAKLEAALGLNVLGRTDLGAYASSVGATPDENKTPGLKTLAQAVLGLELAKPRSLVMSDWAQCILTPAQCEYAALDAWVSRMIYIGLEDGTWSDSTGVTRGPGEKDDRLASWAQEEIRVQRKRKRAERQAELNSK